MSDSNITQFYSVVQGVDQVAVNRFGDLHGTTGRTHTDPDYALRNGYGGTIVQGAFVMAPILEMVARLFGDEWFKGAELEAKFVSFTHPGDQVKVEFELGENNQSSCCIEYICKLLDGKVVQVGTIKHPKSGIEI